MTNEDFIKSISLEGEIWGGVVGCENQYIVSTFGRIISLPKLINGCYGCRYLSKIKLLSCKKDKNGYLRNNNIKGKSSLIHRLVAETFIPNPNNYCEVDHIDGDPSNCCVENLRWCSRVMNQNNPITRDRNSNARKGKINELNGASKSIVAYNSEKVIHFPSIYEAKRNGFARTCIYRCLADPNRIYKNFKFAYISDYENLINKSKNDLPNPN